MTIAVGFLVACSLSSGEPAVAMSAQQPCISERAAAGTRVLVFSRTAAFRHQSIPSGIAAVRVLGERQGFRDLIAEDPDAVWNSLANDGKGCVTDSGESACRGSPRIRPVAMLNPTEWPSIPNGRAEVTISNFAGIFVESAAGGSAWVRFIEFAGVSPVSTWSATSALPKVLRIVE
jgi:hypothetical protein